MVFLPAALSAAVAVKLCVLLVFLWLAEQNAHEDKEIGEELFPCGVVIVWCPREADGGLQDLGCSQL